MSQVSELREKSIEELKEELLQQRRAYFNLRMQKTTGQLTKTDQLRTVRRFIARIYTILTQKQDKGHESAV